MNNILLQAGKISLSEFITKYTQIKKAKHSLRCGTCNKFISNSDAKWIVPIEGFKAEAYHHDCDHP